MGGDDSEDERLLILHGFPGDGLLVLKLRGKLCTESAHAPRLPLPLSSHAQRRRLATRQLALWIRGSEWLLLHHGGYPSFCTYVGEFSVKSILLKISSQNSLVVPAPLVKPRCVKSAHVSKQAQGCSHLHKCRAHFYKCMV